MEISSMLDRLSRDGFPEIAGNKGFKVSQVSMFQGLCNLETLPP
jgi:hypothetical protein